MISKQPIQLSNEDRYAQWIGNDGRVKCAGIEPRPPSARVLRAVRARYLDEVAAITDQLQAMGEE